MEIYYKELTREEAITAQDAGIEVFASLKSKGFKGDPKGWMTVSQLGRIVLNMPIYEYCIRVDPNTYRIKDRSYKELTHAEAVAANKANLEVFVCLVSPDSCEQVLVSVLNFGPTVFKIPGFRYFFRADPQPCGDEEPPQKEEPQKEVEVDHLKVALTRCITIIQCSYDMQCTEEWNSSSKNMQRILAIDAVAGAKKALHGMSH